MDGKTKYWGVLGAVFLVGAVGGIIGAVIVRFGTDAHGVGLTYEGLVTIMLAAVTVILTVLIIGLSVGALYGYSSIRSLIRDESDRAADKAVDRFSDREDALRGPLRKSEDTSPIAKEVSNGDE